MQTPLQITFRHMESSEPVETMIRDKVDWLETFSPHIIGCRVVVEPKGKHHEHGNLHDVRIDITVPGEEIAVTRESKEHTEYKDIHIAIRDAFDSARRRLQDYERRRQGAVKNLETLPQARVGKLFPKEGYGFLETQEGREIYFHRHSVLNPGFDSLKVGIEVTFVEEPGKKGPQARTVKIA